jgi:histidinol-phosphatase (PHP family)
MKGVDYLILGNHNMGNPHNAQEWNGANVNLSMYCEQLVDGIKSGLFSMIAHPDFIFRYYPHWDNDCIEITNAIIKESIKHNIPLEFNLNGLANKRTSMDYPADEFWKLVSCSNAKVIIEADAHQIETLNYPIHERSLKLIKEWNLQKNIIDKLDI